MHVELFASRGQRIAELGLSPLQGGASAVNNVP
jgi:hypothetical protein